ncbi:MAG: hypothetical protein HKN18_12440 [Silicimonas sp.]|nr:hypothetical protein [Silicimonas sp.]
MLGRFRASLWLVALVYFAYSASADTSLRLDPEPEWRHAKSLTELAEVLDTWLDENSGFQRPDKRATIKTISPSVAASIRGISGSIHGRTRGLFAPDASTIYLILPWDAKDAHDASILLHELVHSRQVSRFYYCPGAQEEAAYRLQDDWLRQRGLQAHVNWIAVVLESGCTRRDIHPD